MTDLIPLTIACRCKEVANVAVIVDAVDYEWLRRWRWFICWDKRRRKMYACRNTRRKGRQVKVFMHKEVLKRSGKRKRTKAHKIGDHKNGDSLMNTRRNLRWATSSMNAKNRRADRFTRDYFPHDPRDVA